MKNFYLQFIFLFVSAIAAVYAQSGIYTINGKVGKYNSPAKAYLIRQINKQFVIDSCDVKDGKFKFTGNTPNPFYAQLALDYDGISFRTKNVDVLNFFVDPSTITITASDSISKAKVSGSATNDLSIKYNKEAEQLGLGKQSEQLNKIYKGATPERQNSIAFKDSIENLQQKILDTHNRHMLSFLRKHSQSIYGVFLLQSKINANPLNPAIEESYKLLSNDVRNTDSGKEMASMIAKYRQWGIGDKLPDYTLIDIHGKAVSLSDFNGKYVLLSFWSPECDHCKAEIPYQAQSYSKYKDKGFEIYSIAIESADNKQRWLDLIKEKDMVWTNASDLKLWAGDIPRLYKLFKLPVNFLLDPQGRVVAKDLRGSHISEQLEKLLPKLK